MQEKRIYNENIVEVDSLKEAMSLDTEEKDINIIIINNVSTKGNWKPQQRQNHIPKAIAEDPKNYGKIIIRVGLGYHYLYDTLDKCWVKPLDTDTTSILEKYLINKWENKAMRISLAFLFFLKNILLYFKQYFIIT